MVALLNNPIDSLSNGGEDDDQYKSLIMQQLKEQSPETDSGPSQNQLLASLNSAANQVGAVGGRVAQNPEVQRFADVLDKNKMLGEQQRLAQLQNRQKLLEGLAKIKSQEDLRKQQLSYDQQKSLQDQQFKKDLQQNQQNFLSGMADKKYAAMQDLADTKTQQKPSVAQQAVDRNFAKTYEDFVVQGGFADAEKGIGQLNNMAEKLAKDKTLTGPIRGSTPDFIRQFTNPEALDVKSQVEDVIQRSLKAVLGAQFTEAEGKRVLERAYNEKSPPEVNEARIRRLADQLKKMAESKYNAAKYYESNGTLQGFPGTTTNSVDDMISNIEKEKAPPKSDTAYGATAPNPLANKAPEDMTDAELDQELMQRKGK